MRKLFFILLLSVSIIRLLTILNREYEDKNVRVSGYLYEDPKAYPSNVLIKLKGYRMFLPWDDRLTYGAWVSVIGTVKGQELQKAKLLTVVPPTSPIARARRNILTVLRSSIPEPQSSLVSGMAIGANAIPLQFDTLLKRTGTSHVVVASGGNIAILAGFLESALSRFMRRKFFIIVNLFVLSVYACLVGLGAPIVRALLMWAAVSLSQLTGRVVSQSLILLIVVLVMLIIWPHWVLDVSFWLSVGATSGIMLLNKRIIKRLRPIPLGREALATSLSAQIGILPISFFVFHEVNLLSPIWNTAVLWTVPYITILGMIGGGFSLVIPPIGTLFFVAAYPFALWFTSVISL